MTITIRTARDIDTVEIIKVQSDFPAPILASDGEMRIPLVKSTSYLLDSFAQFELTIPFLVPVEDTDNLKTVGVSSVGEARVTLNYTGTAIMFFGRDSSGLDLSRLTIRRPNGATLFDLRQKPGLREIIELSDLGPDTAGDLGLLDEYAIIVIVSSGIVGFTGPLLINNCGSPLFRDVVWVVPGGSAIPCIILTGTTSTPIADTSDLLLFGSGSSFIAVDSGMTIGNSVQLLNQGFAGSAGTTFFQPDITGSITAFADSVADPGVDTTVTSTAHGLTIFRTTAIPDTTNYNGTHTVTRVVDANNFDINVVFSVDDATGTFTTTSLDEKDVRVRVANSSAQKSSVTIGGFIVDGNDGTTSPGAIGTFVDFNFTNTSAVDLAEAADINERFILTDDSNGEMQYIGINPATCQLEYTYFATSSVNNRTAGCKFQIDRGAGYVDLPDAFVQKEEFTNKLRDGRWGTAVLIDTGDKLKPKLSNQEQAGVTYVVESAGVLIHMVG